MRLDDFDYVLPPERIAQRPIEPRDAARLLVDRGDGPPDHRHVSDLVDLLSDGDLLVVNNTRVLPARLRLRRVSGGSVEVLLLEPVEHTQRVWDAMVRPSRKMRVGEQLVGNDGQVVAEIVGRSPAGDTMHVHIIGEADPLITFAAHGEMPLPPYIHERLDHPDRYQTVYADRPASAAAPTAGLHFTPELLARLQARGVQHETVELVVGLDTFRPIAVDNPLEHVMHSERYVVSDAVVQACRTARRVVAVGTTTVRALESAAATGLGQGRTSIFIHRPFEWKVVDLMMTNFHLPRTTLLMMIDAFVGDRWRDLYQQAVERDYRFLSFGDAMLLDRHAGLPVGM